MAHFTAKWRGAAVVLALAVALILALAACGEEEEGGGGTTGGGDEPKPGGTYNFALAANPVYLDCLNGNYESEGSQVQHQIFEGLMKYEVGDDGNMAAVPCIAEGYEANDEATVFTFTLKKGVMFQPPVSREVTAQDFVDSWDRVTDPENQSYTSYILAPVEGCGDDGYQADPEAGLTGVKALDDYTLEVTLRYPFAEFPLTLGHLVTAASPVEYIDEVGAKEFNEKPVGTGPYMVESWDQNQKVELVKNPDYWDKENAGYVDRIHMPVIEQATTMWLEFQKGTIDYTHVPPGQVKATEENAKVKSGEWTAKKYPTLATYFIGLNMTDKTLGYPAGEKGLLLRQALNYAADRNAVINIVNEGVPLEASTVTPLGMAGYKADLSPYAYDPAKAEEAVAQYGTAPTLNYWYNTDEGHQKIAEALQAGWKTVGIETKLSNFEWGTFLDKLSKSNKGSGSQIFRMGWIADYPSLDNFLYPLFQSDQSRTGSFTFYANDEVDQKLTEARATIDEAQRWALYNEIEEIILTDAPCVPLYYYRDFRVTNNRIAGFSYNPQGFVDMWKVWVAE